MKQLIIGTNKHYPNGSQQLTVGGATYTVTASTALLQSFVDLREAVNAARPPPKRRRCAESSPRSWRT